MPFSLFLRGSIWYLKISEKGHIRWKSTGMTNKVDAQKFLIDFKLQKLKKPTKTPTTIKHSDQCLLSAFAKDCLMWSSSNHTCGSTDLMRWTLKNMIRVLGDIPIASINQLLIDRFKSVRMSEVKPVTVNIELRTLRSAFFQAKRWGLLQEVPISGKNLIKVPSDTVALSENDVEQLINSISDSWLRSLVIMAVHTGLRRNELCRLTWSDFDSVRGLLTIHESKSGKARCIPVSSTVVKMLEQLPKTCEYIFTQDGSHPLKGTWVTHAFKKWCRKLGFSEKVHFHTLRHTCASIMVRNGVSLYHASKVLGHSSVVVTEKYYAHMGVEDLRSAVNVVGSRISTI